MRTLACSISGVLVAAVVLGCARSGEGGGTAFDGDASIATGSAATGGGAVGSSGAGTGAGNGGSGGSSGADGSTGALPFGECDSDADCHGGKCVEVTPGGFHACQKPPTEATSCSSPNDMCCSSSQCPTGQKCFPGPLVPYCGGVPLFPWNQCGKDECGKNADCGSSQICVLAGMLDRKIRSCIPAACKSDDDCLPAGGTCAPVADPCCGAQAGLYCIYSNDGCRSSSDCGPNAYCQINGSKANCASGAPVCPF
jgi:hypothetical protein